MKIAITGAGGFIGSNLVDSLRKEDVDLVLISGAHGNVKLFDDALVVDILDFELMRKSLTGVDLVVHLAGFNSVRESFENPDQAIMVNTMGTSILLNVCFHLDIRRVVIISSAEVYGRPESNPVTESAMFRPLSPYGVSKVAIEQLCYVYYVAYNMNFKILRPFSIYGPGMSSKSLIREIYNSARDQHGVTLFNCSSTRDYCYVGDVTSAIKKALFSEFCGVDTYNIASGIGTNSRQLAEAILTLMDESGRISESPLPDRPRNADIDCLVADVSKAGEELDWWSTTSLNDGLKQTIESFENE